MPKKFMRRISYPSRNCLVEGFYKNIEDIYRFVPEGIKDYIDQKSPFDLRIAVTTYLFALIVSVVNHDDNICDDEIRSIIKDLPWQVEPLWALGLGEYDVDDITKDLILERLNEFVDDCGTKFGRYRKRYATIMSACVECNEAFTPSQVAEKTHFVLVDILNYWNNSDGADKQIAKQLKKLGVSFYAAHSDLKKWCEKNDMEFRSVFKDEQK